MTKPVCIDIPKELKNTVEFYNLHNSYYFNFYNSGLLVFSKIELVVLESIVDFKDKQAYTRVVIFYKHWLGLSSNRISLGFNDFDSAFNFYNWILSEKLVLEEKQYEVI